MSKHEKEIKDTLLSILDFIGADKKYAEYAQLQGWMEQLLARCGVDDWVASEGQRFDDER